MKSLILYGSPKKLTNAHKPVVHLVFKHQSPYYVRAEEFNGDIDEALRRATPKEGETVLNTVPLE